MDPSTASPPEPRASLARTIWSRIVSGMVAALPIVITFWIVSWLYGVFYSWVLGPLARWAHDLGGTRALAGLPWWWDYFVAPVVAILLVLGLLYALGLFVQSRFYRALNWILGRVPIVATIYQGTRNLIESLLQQRKASRPNRVVLVEFPHPGMRSLALVTNSVRDRPTQRTILCVCVLTGVMPPSGFTLFVPEEDVIDLGWSMNQMVQAVLSGGLTIPGAITYSATPPAPEGPSGP